MKTHVCTSRSWSLAMILLALAAVRPVLAQDPNVFPTVTISATDAHASEGGADPGTFTVIRHVAKDTPPPNSSLIVFYQVSGTASNGVDYQTLSGSVTIPPLALGATITVTPIDDAVVEGEETVVVQLTGSPLACATCGYNIAVPSNAVVVIADNDTTTTTNHPPFVQLNAPQNGEVFIAPATITLRAYAQDAEDGNNLKVEFFEGTNSLGFGTFVPTLCPAPYCPFFALTWSNVPPGSYELTARATDANGGVAVSAPARIVVGETNLIQPVVNIFATDDTGREIPVVPPWLGMVQEWDPIVFTVTRTGPTNFPLPVFYRVGGTASNGVDYLYGGAGFSEGLPGIVTIPAGASSADIMIAVIDDFAVEGPETVELTLGPPVWPCFFSNPPCLIVNPPFYSIGPSNQAVAKILDNDLTPPPVVTIVASDPDAAESGLDPGRFTVNRTGETSNPLEVFYTVGGTAEDGVDYLALDPGGFFHIFTGLNFLEIPAGAHSADIIVTPIDDQLAEGGETVLVELRSQAWWPVVVGAPSNAVVTIADNDPVGANLPPSVQMIRPANGEIFMAGTGIQLVAFAQDAEDHYNLQVEFFEGTHSLGLGTFFPGRCAVCPNYGIVWSNVPPGQYTLTATATDSAGASAISAPVRITVVTNPPPPPPPTNGPPVVSIVARDPFASEGTNFWRSDWDANRWAIEIWNPWHVNIGGTNTATFVVRRHGPTNDDLSVSYEVGGTAANGVDYMALPGSVTIPSGKRTAQIVVVPIDDILTEGIETVVLKLRPSPDYAMGFPSHAAAIITDNDQPRPACVLLPDHEFHLCLLASTGFCFRIEASTDLRNWIPVCTNVVTDGALHFVDPDAPPSNVRFYRVEPELGLPPDD